MSAKPHIVKLADMKPGEKCDCFARLAERSRKGSADKPFFICTFRDNRVSRAAAIWSESPLFADCEQTWKVGDCYKLRAAVIETEKYGLQLAVFQVRPVNDGDRDNGFDPLDLLECSRFDPVVMFAELREFAETTIADVPLQTLVLKLLDAHRDQLLLTRGSENKYHPFAGGWLEHTLNVTKSCQQLGEKYRTHYPDLTPPLNMDLLLAGAILHDFGRVAEFGGAMMTERTVPGRLLGHLALGRDLVRDAARDVPDLDPQLLMMLEHIIMSHLTLPEWGSQRLPAIPEVLILHHADDLDAKMEMYMRCLMRDQSPGPFTDRDPILGKQLFKGRRA